MKKWKNAPLATASAILLLVTGPTVLGGGEECFTAKAQLRGSAVVEGKNESANPNIFLPSGRMSLGVNYWASHAATEM